MKFLKLKYFIDLVEQLKPDLEQLSKRYLTSNFPMIAFIYMKMIQNVLNSKLSSNSKKISILGFGLIVVIIYKIWKHLVLGFSANHLEFSGYYFEQIYFNVFRISASILGVVLIKKNYKDFKACWTIGNKKIFICNIFFIIPLYFISRYAMFDFSFKLINFSLELFFNFFTGTFEEIFFRGIILVGISQYLKPGKSILLTSVIFALWHYDVVFHPVYFLSIFIWSMFAGICFLNGASLLSLIIFHFLWDQVYFGFGWWEMSNISVFKIEFAPNMIILFFTILLFGKQIGLRKNKMEQ